MEIKEDGHLHLCINRNIVECKANKSAACGVGKKSINRNIVECKGRTGSNSRAGKGVLIETSWNVKTYKGYVKTYGYPY